MFVIMKRTRALDSSSEEEEPESPIQLNDSGDSDSKSFPVTLHLGGKRPRSQDQDQGQHEGQDQGPAADNNNLNNGAEQPKEDEEEFEMSESDKSSTDSDEYNDSYGRRTLRGFVANSDEESRPRGRPRRRSIEAIPTRSSRRLAAAQSGGNYGSVRNEDTDEDEVRAELRAELRDLRSPSPQRRELRTRQRVNYRILPPPPPEVTSREPGGARKRLSEHRLFPVAGPFGGHDVVSIFKPRKEDIEKTLREINETPSDNTTIVSNSTSQTDSDPLGIETNIDFSSIGGLGDYIDQLKEMVTLPLMYPELYKRFGITPPRGVLFHGPPGTGKTLMARALASMGSRDGRKITFFMRKGGDSLSKWVGEAERQLRVLFDEAKEKQPAIIFFDEIDGLAPVRSSKQEQIHASIVSTLLALMDGLDNRGQVVVIGATNRPDNIDPALRRPGRFDREFYFPLPNAEARQQIVRIHTKKWTPPLEEQFVKKMAELTKGYGGADIKALCTESALNAIQRSYPQIYASEKKLVVVPESISVTPPDVMKALERILPSTVRGATGTTNAPLPSRILPLIKNNFAEITQRLDVLMPKQKRMSPLEVASYDMDGTNFETQRQLEEFKTARVNRPRFLVHGNPGNGQEYIGSAILNYLEGVSNHIIDLTSLFSDSIRTPEAAIIQTLVEAKKRAPSIVLIPNIEMWYDTITPQAQSIFFNTMRTFSPTDRVLVIGISNEPQQELEPQLKQFFGTSACRLHISTDEKALEEFFGPVLKFIESPPSTTMDITDRQKRDIPELPVAEVEKPKQSKDAAASSESTAISEQVKKDNRTRSQLKVKLGSLMEMFQKRYRRFKKPVVEDDELIYLFLPPGNAYANEVDREYVRTDDDMIMEVATGKKYHNMDLDIVEDRLWNGFYCEPRQFLQDLELIHEDSVTLADRDRIHKSSEMVANAQVAIDEIDSAFIDACSELRKREAQKQLAEMENLEDSEQKLIESGADQREVNIEDVSEPIYGDQEQPVAETATEPADPAEEDVSMELESPHINGKGPGARAQDPVASLPTPVLQASPPSDPNLGRKVTVNAAQLAALKDKILKLCANNDLDQLELVFSSLADAAWEHRCDWDRSAMIQGLSGKIEQLRELIE